MNGHLLGAPREYVLLLLLLLPSISILLISFGPPIILLFTPMAHVSCSNPSLPTGRLNTNVQVNNIATLHHIYTDTHIYITLYYYSFPSTYFFHSLGQAGWLRPFSSVTLPPAGLPFITLSHLNLMLLHLPPWGPSCSPARRSSSSATSIVFPLVSKAQLSRLEVPDLASEPRLTRAGRCIHAAVGFPRRPRP